MPLQAHGATPSGNLEHYRIDALEYEYVAQPGTNEYETIRRRCQLLCRMAGVDGLSTDERSRLRVLDVGVGGGQLLQELSRYAVSAVGLDIALHNCQRVRELLQKQNVTAICSAADVYRLPFRTESLDLIFISEVLEHLESPVDALLEVARVLRPGGKVVASCPWRQKIVYHLCIHCNKPTPAHAHLQTVDERKMSDWMREAGLEATSFVRFNNKLLHAAQWERRTAAAPYGFWRATDSLANSIVPRVYHFAALGRKS